MDGGGGGEDAVTEKWVEERRRMGKVEEEKDMAFMDAVISTADEMKMSSPSASGRPDNDLVIVCLRGVQSPNLQF